MSEAQRLEELAYDTREEYRNVLRAEAFDPMDEMGHCSEHDVYYELEDGRCEHCPDEFPPVESFPNASPWDNPPF